MTNLAVIGHNEPPPAVRNYPCVFSGAKDIPYKEAREFMVQKIHNPRHFYETFKRNISWGYADDAERGTLIAVILHHADRTEGLTRWKNNQDCMSWGRKQWVKRHGEEFIVEVERILYEEHMIQKTRRQNNDMH